MRMLPTPEQLLAGLAGLLVLAGLAWWSLLSLPTAPHDLPSWKGQPVNLARAVAPQIGDFERDYAVNPEDPFVPYLQRENDVRIAMQPKNSAPPVPVNPNQPTRPPTPPEPPVIHWSKPSFTATGAPICVGEILCDAGQVVMVRMHGSQEIIRLNIGDSVPANAASSDQWTLESVIDNNLARFKHDGAVEDLPIGGPLPDPPPSSPAPSGDAGHKANANANANGSGNGQAQGQGGAYLNQGAGGQGGQGGGGNKPRRPRPQLIPGMVPPPSIGGPSK